MKIRLFRFLVCLAVICSLLIGISPIKARAVAAEGGVIKALLSTGNPYAIAAGAIIMLGVMADPNGPEAFETLVSKATDIVTTVGAEALSLVNEAGEIVWYASAELFESIRSWLFDSGTVVTHGETFAAGSTITLNNGDEIAVQQKCYRVQFVGKSVASGWLLYDWIFSQPDENLTYYKNGSDVLEQGTVIKASDTASYRVYRSYQSISSGLISDYPSIGVENVDYSENTSWRIARCFEAGLLGITVADGLLLGEVPLEPITSGLRDDVLSDWASKQVWITYTDSFGIQQQTEVYYPIYLSPLRELIGRTQEELLAQAGLLIYPQIEWEYEDEYEILDHSLIEGLFQGLKLVEAEAQAPGGGTDVILPPTDYSMDLTEFFPFCLPFDLYEFFRLLSAEPEAPVFEWVIPVPQSEEEFCISVDLSAWDGVAKLFRTFVLLMFIVGLVKLTRDKFLRG